MQAEFIKLCHHTGPKLLVHKAQIVVAQGVINDEYNQYG